MFKLECQPLLLHQRSMQQNSIKTLNQHGHCWNKKRSYWVSPEICVICWTRTPSGCTVTGRSSDYSVLQSSLIRGLTTPWTYFIHLSLSSVILIDSSTWSPVHVLMLSIQAVRGLPLFLACVHLALFFALSLFSGNSLVSSWCDRCKVYNVLSEDRHMIIVGYYCCHIRMTDGTPNLLYWLRRMANCLVEGHPMTRLLMPLIFKNNAPSCS